MKTASFCGLQNVSRGRAVNVCLSSLASTPYYNDNKLIIFYYQNYCSIFSLMTKVHRVLSVVDQMRQYNFKVILFTNTNDDDDDDKDDDDDNDDDNNIIIIIIIIIIINNNNNNNNNDNNNNNHNNFSTAVFYVYLQGQEHTQCWC